MGDLIRIDLPKGIEDGSTSVSPQSPSNTSLASPGISRKGAIMLGYGVMAGKAVYNTAINEIKAGGNEELATDMSNITTAAGIAIGAIATGGLSLIPTTIQASTQAFTQARSTARQNRAREYEASMRGSRVTYGSGGYE